jgi:hypothetical protein
MIMVGIGFIFAIEGYFTIEKIYPNKAHAALAVVVIIALFKLIKSTRRI